MTMRYVTRQQLIQRALPKIAGEAGDVTSLLWQPLARQLSSIIGEGGVKALYARSMDLTHVSFPWLAAGDSGDSGFQFPELKASLASRDHAETNRAIGLLLLTFTDILASLVGESLTIGILLTSWGDDPSLGEMVGEEMENE